MIQTENFTLKEGRISYELSVTYGGRTMIVFIPKTGDSQWDAYLIEGEKEKTLNELKGRPAKKVISKPTQAEAVGALRQFNRDMKKRRQNTRGKLFY